MTETSASMRVGDRAWEEPDSQRIRRLMARFIGGGYVAYFLIAAPSIRVDAGLVAPWWTPLAVLVVFIPGWLLLGVSFTRSPLFTHTILPIACGGGYIIAVALWFLAWTGERGDTNTGTWLVTFPGLAALALVVTPWPWASLVHLSGVTVAVQAANSAARAPQYGQLSLADIAWAIAFSGVFVLAGIMSVRTGDRLDDTKAHNILLSELVHTQRGQEYERNLYDRLVHDKVLGLLRNAERANTDPSIGNEARKLLRDWDELTSKRSSKRPIDASYVLALIREEIQHIDPSLEVDPADERAHTSPVVPLRVGYALADASAEAVRNAYRHVGAKVGIELRVQLNCEPLIVIVADDGPGFERSAIAAPTLGLSRSIVDRMSEIGGLACIETRKDAGTTVELRWPR